MSIDLLNQYRTEILELAENGRWGDALSRIDENPELAVAKFDFDNTLLIDLACLPKASAVIYRLIELGANVNHRSGSGKTAIEQTLWGGSNHGLSTLDELKLLLEKGADPSVGASTGAPLLQLAIERSRLEHAKLLLENGASPAQLSADLRPENAFDVAKRLRNTAALELLDRFK